MSEQIEVEALGDHDYLVRVRHSTGVEESRFRVTPEVLAKIGASEDDGRRVVEQSAALLLAHQPAIDLPAMVDLDDMAAAFDDYLPRLRERITGS
ncbi:hypothetical protein KDK95_01840 [Actinospica sp. MGRD01-02]|uniref:Uncharacterized protein n=1 Tax=Actinospica acidithermotolerans TaxID=2828514 RepID=A0A941IEB3_9ACTN|nr:hypothetical protein [Actinospica acidithermotolerans]MBR7825030.1 hypothetical protein [Actinospica acidithermotolerans]